MGCSPTTTNQTPIKTSNIQNGENKSEENEQNEENEEEENSNETPENHLSQIEEILDENSNTRKDIITIHLNKSNTNLLNSNTQKSLIIEEVTLTKENENNSVSQNNNIMNNKFIENTIISMNSNYNKRIKNINEIFKINEEKTKDDNLIINVIVKANKYEIMYPIWIENNKKVKFNVSGKWKIDDKNECDCRGIIQNNKNKLNDYNNGALIGRIFNGESFEINDNLEFISKNSGPLFLRMNVYNFIDKNYPCGELKLKITGAQYIKSYEEIDSKIGWNKKINNIEYYNESDINIMIPKFERDLIIIINKIRTNPCLFAIQYLENIKNLTKTSKDLYQYTITQGKNKFDNLKVNVTIFKLLESFYKEIMKNENKSKDKKDIIIKSENELINFFNKKFESKKEFKIIMKKHYCKNPISLSIKLLFDNQVKNEIFKKENKEIEIITIKIKKLNKVTFFTILIFSEEYGNCGIDFNDFLLQFQEEKQEEEKELEKTINEEKTNRIKSSGFTKYTKSSKRILTEFDIINNFDNKSKVSNEFGEMKRYYTTKVDKSSNSFDSNKSFNSEEEDENSERKEDDENSERKEDDDNSERKEEEEEEEHESSSQIGVSVDFKSHANSSL